MSRVKMPSGLQRKLLAKAEKSVDFDLKHLAKICGVNKRTLFDWRREKYQMSYEALKKLHKASRVHIPKNIKILPEYWNIPKAASAGGKVVAKLYGGPGTPEGRKKGGINSQKKIRNNPDFVKCSGFKLRKKIKRPEKKSLLTEFIGIMLGDGHIDNYQITITVSNKVDYEYSQFVVKLIERLFGITSGIQVRRNALVIVVSSRSVVDFLINCGLKKGNKILQQVDVPEWIFEKKEYMKQCLRGLIDTDGGIYYHNHITKGIKYRHMGLCFTSCSFPLLQSTERMFLATNINGIKRNKKNRLYLYGREKVGEYLDVIGTSNPKHLARYQHYKHSKQVA